MSKKIIILKGLPASGKSTWAKEQVEKSQGGCKRVNKDDLRTMIDDGKFSKGNEKFVVQIRNNLIVEALKAGKHVIVDDQHEIGSSIESLLQPRVDPCRKAQIGGVNQQFHIRILCLYYLYRAIGGLVIHHHQFVTRIRHSVERVKSLQGVPAVVVGEHYNINKGKSRHVH